jgi:hypothetical protein
MFGTLVISLPSAHKGGEVVAKHRGQKKIFKTCEAVQSYICWYSDVFHEVRPVTSGYRWVLTYNLAIDPSVEPPSAGLLRGETRFLRHTIKKWLLKDEQDRDADHLYYSLDHQYTEANISLRGLKTRDLALVQCLQRISAELPFDIFLAVLEKEEIGEGEYGYGCYDEDEDEYNRINNVIDITYRLKKLTDLNGNQLAEGMTLKTDNIIQDLDSCFDGDPDDECHEEYMGNSVRKLCGDLVNLGLSTNSRYKGPSSTYWYRLSASLGLVC